MADVPTARTAAQGRSRPAARPPGGAALRGPAGVIRAGLGRRRALPVGPGLAARPDDRAARAGSGFGGGDWCSNGVDGGWRAVRSGSALVREIPALSGAPPRAGGPARGSLAA